MATMKPYILDDAATVEYQRLDLMSKILDPWTRDYLRTLGVGPGWNCLELGPGNGSITEWLCAAVGSTCGPCCVRPGPASMVSKAWSRALASAVAVDVPAHRGQWSIAEEHLRQLSDRHRSPVQSPGMPWSLPAPRTTTPGY